MTDEEKLAYAHGLEPFAMNTLLCSMDVWITEFRAHPKVWINCITYSSKLLFTLPTNEQELDKIQRMREFVRQNAGDPAFAGWAGPKFQNYYKSSWWKP
jgi:hypothetical protein